MCNQSRPLAHTQFAPACEILFVELGDSLEVGRSVTRADRGPVLDRDIAPRAKNAKARTRNKGLRIERIVFSKPQCFIIAQRMTFQEFAFDNRLEEAQLAARATGT
jgi:hypothetical protein